jgi:hypothetical protein
MTTEKSKSKGMTKDQMIREVRDVVCGQSPMQYAVYRREGKRWHRIDWGIGQPLRENYPSDALIFQHDRNKCRLLDASEIVEQEIKKGLIFHD